MKACRETQDQKMSAFKFDGENGDRGDKHSEGQKRTSQGENRIAGMEFLMKVNKR